MKFILINTRRVNVYLSKEDLEGGHIRIEDFYVSGSETKKRLSEIFNMAKRVSGFDAESNKYEIDVVPIVGGELLLSISGADEMHEKIYIKEHIMCYSFANLEQIFEAAKQIHELFEGKTSIYKMENKYYFILNIKRVEVDKIADLRCILCEYGNESEVRSIYVVEHGHCLIKNNAMEKILTYFC